MRKSIISLAIAAITVFTATNAIAGNRNKQNRKNDRRQYKTEQCDQACPRTCADSTKCNRPCPFDGLDLTAEQQKQLQEIMPVARMGRQAKCVNDTCKFVKGDKKQVKREKVSREKRRADRKEYLEKVKKILTPEQYTKFLENSLDRPQGHGGKRHHRR